jgi:hypothetical protein
MAAKALARFRSRCEQVRNYRLTPRDANSCEKISDYFSNAIRINLSENLPDAIFNLIDSVAKKHRWNFYEYPPYSSHHSHPLKGWDDAENPTLARTAKSIRTIPALAQNYSMCTSSATSSSSSDTCSPRHRFGKRSIDGLTSKLK